MASPPSNKPAMSSALTRKSTDTDLMPPPPLKRIKRPPKVLDEDSYTDALSEIIARDFFPGLLETKHQQEYLDALESRDTDWILSASRKLTEVMATPQHRRRGTSFATPRFRDGTATPSAATPGATPASTASAAPTAPAAPALDTSLSLDAFQAKYTSEDNASFNTILDKQNEKRRNAYAFLWSGNHIPGFRTIAHNKRIAAQAADAAQRQIVAPDTRPAVPNTWKAEPRNGLMFTPEGSPPPRERPDGDQELPAKAVVYKNTRMPAPAPARAERAASPSSTAIADAIAGRPRPLGSEDGRAATPRVRGYSFVDSAPSPSPANLGAPPLTWGAVAAISDTAPSPSPFKIAATPKRELLHHRMVEKVARGKRVPNPQLAATAASASPRMTPLGGGREIPKFGNSPALTPAGQRLWGNLTARREGVLARRETGTPAAAGAGGRGFRWVPTPKAGK